jgi:hypothetical protein
VVICMDVVAPAFCTVSENWTKKLKSFRGEVDCGFAPKSAFGIARLPCVRPIDIAQKMQASMVRPILHLKPIAVSG